MYLTMIPWVFISTMLLVDVGLAAAAIEGDAVAPNKLTTHPPASLTFDWGCTDGVGPLISQDDCENAIDTLELESDRNAPPIIYTTNAVDPKERVPMRANFGSCQAVIFLNYGAIIGVARPRDLKLILLGLNQSCNPGRPGLGRGGAATAGGMDQMGVGLRYAVHGVDVGPLNVSIS